jgi:hypothetical protein
LSFEGSSEAGTEFTVDDGATNLEQEIGAASGPPHLLGFVHAAVDQVLMSMNYGFLEVLCG